LSRPRPERPLSFTEDYIALTETIRLMSATDQVINAHGGWPGAF